MTQLPDIIETFELLGDWDARYNYVIDIGKKLPPLAEEHKVDANRVNGCMSNVRVAGEISGEDGRTLLLSADSDTPVVKGHSRRQGTDCHPAPGLWGQDSGAGTGDRRGRGIHH